MFFRRQERVTLRRRQTRDEVGPPDQTPHYFGFRDEKREQLKAKAREGGSKPRYKTDIPEDSYMKTSLGARGDCGGSHTGAPTPRPHASAGAGTQASPTAQERPHLWCHQHEKTHGAQGFQTAQREGPEDIEAWQQGCRLYGKVVKTTGECSRLDSRRKSQATWCERDLEEPTGREQLTTYTSFGNS